MGAMASTNGRVRRAASEWQGLVKRYVEGGRSRAAFCRAEGISASTLALWERKLGLEKRRTPRREFIELEPSRPEFPGGWVFEIELPDGRMARFRG